MNAPLRGLGMLAATMESARQTLLLLRHMRIWWIVCLAAVLLATVLFVLGARAHDRIEGRNLFCLVAWWLQTTVVAPWLTLHLGVQAVHGGIEDRTFQYLFLRPVGRAPLLLGKWLAVAATATVLALVVTVALFAAVAARTELWPDGVEGHLLLVFVQVQALGALAYSAVAVFFGSAFRRPLVWAAFFVVGLQMLTANLDVSAGLRRLTITDPLRRWVLDGVEPDARLARVLWPAEREFVPELIGEPLWDLGLLTLCCLVLALWRYCRTEYDSRDRE